MYQLVDLTGRRIVVTGASSGIGRETAVVLSRLGAEIILVARRKEQLEETLSLLEAGRNHSYYVADLADIDEIESLVQTIVRDGGAVDGLAYCAGISADLPIKMMKPDKFDRIMKINLYGFVEMVRCLSKKKNYNEGMRIVGVASVSAFIGGHIQMGYSASKAGMNGAMRCMASELALKGICVNTVAPAMIETQMYEAYLDTTEEDSFKHKVLLERQYLGIGKTSDVANSIAFLLSSAARFITGVCLPVDGGFTST